MPPSTSGGGGDGAELGLELPSDAATLNAGRTGDAMGGEGDALTACGANSAGHAGWWVPGVATCARAGPCVVWRERTACSYTRTNTHNSSAGALGGCWVLSRECAATEPTGMVAPHHTPATRCHGRTRCEAAPTSSPAGRVRGAAQWYGRLRQYTGVQRGTCQHVGRHTEHKLGVGGSISGPQRVDWQPPWLKQRKIEAARARNRMRGVILLGEGARGSGIPTNRHTEVRRLIGISL